eukprot:TRINITY_DN2348_c0_g1_i4.p1 TRINITY_DN2348_c0_g1~~TRINITY_DN2348_c0_g1_i4.p1  ORF type:complete len:389 (+),score=39.95 TRINITY_DN2348_c0_g1_i4:3-1169(+)
MMDRLVGRDVLPLILSFLSPDDVVNFESVNKEYRQVIAELDWWKKCCEEDGLIPLVDHRFFKKESFKQRVVIRERIIANLNDPNLRVELLTGKSTSAFRSTYSSAPEHLIFQDDGKTHEFDLFTSFLPTLAQLPSMYQRNYSFPLLIQDMCLIRTPSGSISVHRPWGPYSSDATPEHSDAPQELVWWDSRYAYNLNLEDNPQYFIGCNSSSMGIHDAQLHHIIPCPGIDDSPGCLFWPYYLSSGIGGTRLVDLSLHFPREIRRWEICHKLSTAFTHKFFAWFRYASNPHCISVFRVATLELVCDIPVDGKHLTKAFVEFAIDGDILALLVPPAVKFYKIQQNPILLRTIDLRYHGDAPAIRFLNGLVVVSTRTRAWCIPLYQRMNHSF